MTFTTTPRRLAKTLAIAAGMSFVSMSAFAGGDAALYGPTAADAQDQQAQSLASLPTPPILHNTAIAVAILGPIALLLPGKGRGRISIQNTILGSGSFWAINQLAYDYSGKSIVSRSNERWGAILSSTDALPSQAETNKKLMEAERERLRRLKAGLPPLEEGAKEGEEKRGVLGKVWMGDEKEDWKARRLEEERKALESGKGYADLITEQIWDVWNQTWSGGKKAEEKGKKDEAKSQGGEKDGKQ